MIKFGKAVVKLRIPILILSIFLLIPSAIGYFNTRVNYDILTYLPEEIETMKGQDLLLDEFGTGAFSFCVVEGMDAKDISAMREQMEEVPHVKSVIWYDSLADISIPMEMLPDEIYDFFNNDEKDSTLLAVLYDTSMSADETMDAIEELRGVVKDQCYISGMSAVVTDIKNLSNKETPVYVLIAVVLAVIVLSLTMDSALAPIFFLLSIGMAIVYNLGTNVFKGEISYVTQALAAVLQLGVTMDYSIFLWHSYEEQQERFQGDKKRAMAHAISNTITSVVGSSITTVAGFVALCFMSFTLGMDLGIVMAKGVVLGVICCVTVLPSLLLVFDKAIEKTKHKVIIPDLGRIADWIVRHYGVFLIVFLVVLGPAIYGYTHTDVYYDLAGTLPKSLSSITANDKLNEDFEMGATHMIIADSSLSAKDASAMLDEISKVDGVKMACIQFWVCALVAGVGMLIFEHPTWANILAAWKPILYAGAMSSGVGYTLQIVGQKGMNPAVASLIMSLESVISVIAGWLILGQALSGREIFGCVLMFGAIVLAQLPERKKQSV